jgi:hypothetical protein
LVFLANMDLKETLAMAVDCLTCCLVYVDQPATSTQQMCKALFDLATPIYSSSCATARHNISLSPTRPP